MDDVTNESLSESGNADPVTRDEVTEDKDNENTERMQLWASNYIILRNIMSHLDWQDRLRCAVVCRLWRDEIESLQRKNLRCYDFAMGYDELCESEADRKPKLVVSSLPVQTRPMFAIAFFDYYLRHVILCDTKHEIIEALDGIMLPACLLAVFGNQIYMPLPTSRTSQYTVYEEFSSEPSWSLVAGLYLPKIPNVNYRTIQYRTERTVQEDFYIVVDEICRTDIIKGVIAFVQFQFDHHKTLALLNYFKDKQPNIPFALGGCEVRNAHKGTGTERDTPVIIGVFSIPKEPKPVLGPSCQFNMYSLVIDSTVEERVAVEKVIHTFAENISELEFSAALMLTCTDCWRLHEVVQELFRATFPRATIVGCYSFREEIGRSHPQLDDSLQQTTRTNRLYEDGSEILHEDSTVFVYFTWGKQRTRSAEVTPLEAVN